MQPGWYDDPFARGWLRWWDGTAWSPHQAPAGPPPAPVLYGTFAPTPAADLAAEVKWARYARWAFIAGAVLNVLAYLIFLPLLGEWFRHVFHTCQQELDAGATSCDNLPGTGHQYAIQALSAPLIVPQVVIAIWLMQAARIGRRLGLPARRDPGWAFAFFVPVVNLWFPYQVAADTLPPDSPDRPVVGWWWAFWLTAGLVAIPVLVLAAVFSAGVGAVAGAIGCVLPVLAGIAGYRMVGRIEAVHRQLLTR